MERISVECRNTKNKFIKTANQNKGKDYHQPIRTQRKEKKKKKLPKARENAGKRGKTRLPELQLVSVLSMIG